jgi:PAS domain S-box-containing protein
MLTDDLASFFEGSWPSFAQIVAALFFCLSTIGAADAQDRDPRVLLLYPYDNVHGASTISGEAARRRLNEQFKGRIEIYSDFLDLLRFPDDEHRALVARFLASKYAQTRLDLIVALNTETYRFSLGYRDVFAVNVPVVFCCVTRALIESSLSRPADMAGIVADYDIVKTLELAARLQPQARTVIFAGGASSVDRGWLEMYQTQAAPLRSRYEFRVLGGLTYEALLDEVGKVPRNSIIVLGTLFEDGAGRQRVSWEVAADVARAAAAPVYAPIDTYLGRGIVGGYMGAFEDAGIEVADLAAEVLRGGDIQKIATRSSAAQRFRVDARELQRWGMSTSALPSETVVDFKKPTLWAQYRNAVISALAIIAVQGVLIALLLVQVLRRRRAEASLRESEGRWRSVFETSTVGIALANHDMKYLAANSAFQTMLGYTSDELSALSPLDISTGADLDAARAVREELRDGRRTHYEAVREYRRKDNAPIWVHEHVSIVPSADGQAAFYIETAIDITGRIRAENAKQAAQDELARVGRRTTMGELTASIAHEVNQPLAAIVANSNAGLRWLNNSTPDLARATAAFDRIVKEGHRAGRVIKNIRAMFRKDTGAKRDLDLVQLMLDVLLLLPNQLNKNGIVVDTQFESGLPTIRADPVQLQQVALNLIINAVEAMSSTEERTRVLKLRVQRKSSDALAVTVEDSGPGISPDSLERIFEAFYTTKPEGMGMGLSICRSIIEAHDGSLSVRHAEPHGSIFEIVLPVGDLGHRHESKV